MATTASQLELDYISFEAFSSAEYQNVRPKTQSLRGKFGSAHLIPKLDLRLKAILPGSTVSFWKKTRGGSSQIFYLSKSKNTLLQVKGLCSKCYFSKSTKVLASKCT